MAIYGQFVYGSESAPTGRDILFKVAEDVGATRSAFVSEVQAQTQLRCNGLSLGQTQSFTYGLARIIGKGIRQITGYRDADQRVTVASSFDSTVSAGELIEVCWWDADRAALAQSAVNEAIRESWPWFYRQKKTPFTLTGTVSTTSSSTTVTGSSTVFSSELVAGDVIKIGSVYRTIDTISSDTSLVVTSAYTSTVSAQTCTIESNITLASGTHFYNLPVSVHYLIGVGIRSSTSDPISWFPPLANWRVTGLEGGYQVQFLEGYGVGGVRQESTTSVSTATATPMLTGGSFADAYSTDTLELWYATREPELTSMSASTQLPLQFFQRASEIYIRRRMAQIGSDSPEFSSLAAIYPEVKRVADETRPWLWTMVPPLGSLRGPEIQL